MNAPTIDPRKEIGPTVTKFIRRLVAPRHGLVTNLSEHNNPECAPGMFVSWTSAYVRRSFQAPEAQQSSTLLHGAGIGLSRETSIMSCLGELLERWAAWDSSHHRITKASAAELDRAFLNPSSLIGFDDEQLSRPNFRYQRFHEEMAISWVEGTRLRDGAPILVPAQAVFLDPALWAEPQLIQMNSSGLACGASVAAVITSGLHEAVERDAFAASWLLRRRVPRMARSDVQARLPAALREVLATTACELRVMDLTTDIAVPVFTASLTVRGSLKGVVFGAAANADPCKALEKAVIESLQSLCWATQAVRTRDIDGMQMTDVLEFLDHAAYYLEPSRAAEIDWFGECSPSSHGASATWPDASVPALDAVLARGFDPIFVDISNPNLRDLGMVAGRVIVPGLHPLHAGFGLEARDRRRLDQLANWLGMPIDTPVNRQIHPFP